MKKFCEQQDNCKIFQNVSLLRCSNYSIITSFATEIRYISQLLIKRLNCSRGLLSNGLLADTAAEVQRESQFVFALLSRLVPFDDGGRRYLNTSDNFSASVFPLWCRLGFFLFIFFFYES